MSAGRADFETERCNERCLIDTPVVRGVSNAVFHHYIVARLIWEGLQSHGVDADAVFREAGLDPGALDDSGARYPADSMGRLWQLAELRSSDSCFGLTAAEQWYPTTWHGLGYA